VTENTTSPSHQQPSSSTLLRSTLIAALVAATLLVTTVLPAEYGVDPTGIGRVLGLTEMGEIKRELAKEAAAAEAAERANAARDSLPAQRANSSRDSLPAAATDAPVTRPAATAMAGSGAGAATAPAATTVRSDSIVIELRPSQSSEIKLVMKKGARVSYAWTSEPGGVSFETHGDTAGAPPGVFHSYSKGRNTRSHEGSFVAVFDGMHGWFWRNRTSGAVTITLRTTGEYLELKRL